MAEAGKATTNAANQNLKTPWPIYATATALVVFIGTLAGGAPVQINIQPGVRLSWPTSTNDIYQPQWSAGSGNGWNALGGGLPGNGQTNSLYDPVLVGARNYQVLEMVPGSVPASATVTNGGFESGSGTTAGNWVVDTAAGGPVYGARTNDNPHSGAYNF